MSVHAGNLCPVFTLFLGQITCNVYALKQIGSARLRHFERFLKPPLSDVVMIASKQNFWHGHAAKYLGTRVVRIFEKAV